MDYEAFGQRVRDGRKAKRLTQDRMAFRVEISSSFLGHIERGSRVPSIETVAKISKVLGVSIDHLVFGRNSIASYAEKIVIVKTSN